MDDWPFAADGTLILPPAVQRVIAELRSRRDAGQSLKRLAAWAQDVHGIEITTAGLYRLLKIVQAQNYQTKQRRRLTLALVRDPPE